MPYGPTHKENYMPCGPTCKENYMPYGPTHKENYMPYGPPCKQQIYALWAYLLIIKNFAVPWAYVCNWVI